jgi:hypothetical protein
MISALFPIIVALAPTASDHLIPPPGLADSYPLTAYQVSLARLFLSEPDISLYVIRVPSRRAESAMVLTDRSYAKRAMRSVYSEFKANGAANVIPTCKDLGDDARKASCNSQWQAAYFSFASRVDVPIEKKPIAVTPQTQALLVCVWRAVLTNVAPELTDPVSRDGTRYYFGLRLPGVGFVEGLLHADKNNGAMQMAQLAKLVDLLLDGTFESQPDFATVLDPLARSLCEKRNTP